MNRSSQVPILSELGSSALRVTRSPAAWLVTQLVVATWFLASTGALEYRRVPDTASYLETANAESLAVALGQYRTIGYPAFLELFRGAEGAIRLGRVPIVHWLLFAVSILLFFVGMARLSRARWLAFSAATPLIYSPSRLLVDRIQPDFLAMAANVAAFALLFLLLARPTRLRWVAFGGIVLASYQLRPAGVFLVVLLPFVAGMAQWLGAGWTAARARRVAARVALVTVLPLLVFSGVRWMTVGHFGLVSFGGFNAMGMAASFLDHRLINHLPEAQRPLARAIFRERNQRGYEPMTRSDDPRDYFAQYSPNIFSISASTTKQRIKQELARRRAQSGESRLPGGLPLDWPVEVNRRLSDLAGAIMVRRPVLCSNWFRAAFLYGTEQLARWLWITWPALLLVVLLPIRAWRSTAPARDGTDADRARYGAVVTLLLSGVGLFTGHLLIVSLVSFPFQRYVLSMILLLPSLLTALVFETARAILPGSPAETSSEGEA